MDQISGDRERAVVVGQGVSFLSFWPWRHDLLQGTTFRHLRSNSGKQFDLRDRTSSGSVEVEENWKLFSETIGKNSKFIIEMEQTHENEVKTVNVAGSKRQKSEDKWFRIEACDGLISNEPGVLLTARVADCVPLFLYDRIRGVIGLIHAGWRGTAAGILQEGILQMRDGYGVSSSDITIYLGPAIEKPCYTVDRTVYQQFARWVDPGQLSGDEGEISLREILRKQALEAGVPEDGIYKSGFCTRCSRDLFYSHRGSGGCKERMLAFLGFRK